MESNQTLNETNTTCILPYDITENQWIFYESFTWWIEGFGSVLIGSMGIFFNLTTIWVLLGSELAASFFNWLLVCLAVFDSFFLLNGILEALRNHLGSTSIHNYLFVVFLFPFRSIVMCCSIYMTVILALERYNALARPTSHHGHGARSGGKHSLRNYFELHWVRVLKYVGPIVILASIFYIPKRMELEMKTCTKNETLGKYCKYDYEVVLTELRSNNHYILWYLNVTNLLVTAVIPLLSLIYLNLKIYLKFKCYLQRQPLAATAASNLAVNNAQEKIRKREKDMIQQTMILFAIVILFGLFHALRIILNIEEFASLDKSNKASEIGCEWLQFWTIIAAPVSNLLIQINSSINFFLYCFLNNAFKFELVSMLKSMLAVFKKGDSTERISLQVIN